MAKAPQERVLPSGPIFVIYARPYRNAINALVTGLREAGYDVDFNDVAAEGSGDNYYYTAESSIRTAEFLLVCGGQSDWSRGTGTFVKEVMFAHKLIEKKEKSREFIRYISPNGNAMEFMSGGTTPIKMTCSVVRNEQEGPVVNVVVDESEVRRIVTVLGNALPKPHKHASRKIRRSFSVAEVLNLRRPSRILGISSDPNIPGSEVCGSIDLANAKFVECEHEELRGLLGLMVLSGSFSEFYRRLYFSEDRLASDAVKGNRELTSILLREAVSTIYAIDLPVLKALHSIFPCLDPLLQRMRLLVKNLNTAGNIVDRDTDCIYDLIGPGDHAADDSESVLKIKSFRLLQEGISRMAPLLLWRVSLHLEDMHPDLTASRSYFNNVYGLKNVGAPDHTAREAISDLRRFDNDYDSIEHYFKRSVDSARPIAISTKSTLRLVTGLEECLSTDPEGNPVDVGAIYQAFHDIGISFAHAYVCVLLAADYWAGMRQPRVGDISTKTLRKAATSDMLNEHGPRRVVAFSNDLIVIYHTLVGSALDAALRGHKWH